MARYITFTTSTESPSPLPLYDPLWVRAYSSAVMRAITQ